MLPYHDAVMGECFSVIPPVGNVGVQSTVVPPAVVNDAGAE